MPDVPVKEVDGSQKAAILKISNRLCVRFKHDGVQQKIPKGSWALRGKQRGKVLAGEVLLYSFGDEMYKKVNESQWS